MKLTRFEDVAILSTGHHLPDEVRTTADLGLADGLVRLTGVARRHVAPPEHATSDLVLRAAQAALADLTDVGTTPIDRVLVATVTPDHPSPATAPLLQHQLGLDTVPACDLGAACAGFVYALDLAARCVLTGDRAVLVAAGECRFRTLTDATPGVRVLFGAGAGAAVIGSAREPHVLRLVATVLGSDGRGHGAVQVPAGGSRLPTTVAAGQHSLRMSDGPHVFFQAVDGLVDVARALLTGLDLLPADLDLIVPHQANLRILERVARVLRVPLDRFVLDVAETGNVGGASVAIALDRARRAGRIPPGARVLLLTTGAGYTAGAALLEAPR